MSQYSDLVYLPVYRKMDDHSSISVCFLCKKEVSGDDGVNVTRGLETLVKVSKERKDNHDKFLQQQSSVHMHELCRKRYTLKRNESFPYKNFVPDETKRFDHLNSPQKKKPRDSFDFKSNCVLTN